MAHSLAGRPRISGVIGAVTDALEFTAEGDPMIDVYESESGRLLGTITDAELQVLVDALVEESDTDQDYYIDAATIDLLGDGRATDHLMQLLRTALGRSEGVDIRWQRR